jgi:hypothetical protein
MLGFNLSKEMMKERLELLREREGGEKGIIEDVN